MGMPECEEQLAAETEDAEEQGPEETPKTQIPWRQPPASLQEANVGGDEYGKGDERDDAEEPPVEGRRSVVERGHSPIQFGTNSRAAATSWTSSPR